MAVVCGTHTLSILYSVYDVMQRESKVVLRAIAKHSCKAKPVGAAFSEVRKRVFPASVPSEGADGTSTRIFRNVAQGTLA